MLAHLRDAMMPARSMIIRWRRWEVLVRRKAHKSGSALGGSMLPSTLTPRGDQAATPDAKTGSW